MINSPLNLNLPHCFLCMTARYCQRFRRFLSRDFKFSATSDRKGPGCVAEFCAMTCFHSFEKTTIEFIFNWLYIYSHNCQNRKFSVQVLLQTSNILELKMNVNRSATGVFCKIFSDGYSFAKRQWRKKKGGFRQSCFW